MSLQTFTRHVAGIDWYCEARGSGPHIVLIPSGEGDCSSFARVADDLAQDFSVLTFDMPGFSRSGPPPDWRDVSANAVAGQIAALTASLGIDRASYYGCSSGGLFALALAAEHPNIVDAVMVHEVAVPLDGGPPDGPFAGLFSADDATVVETCKFLFREMMNEDQYAWDSLGKDYHQSLEKNYVTWARRYVGLYKLDVLNGAQLLEDLRSPPGNRLESLRGDLEGFYSIRINVQWRIIFRWVNGSASDVQIVDYH